MDITEYIENRLKKQQVWYEQKANTNKSRFMSYQTVIIILGALIPLIVVFENTLKGWPDYISASHISAVIAAIIAILAGLDKLTQPQANWFNYRSNEEMLKKEEWMYHFKTSPYNNLNDKEAEKLLVDRVESIISADIARFAQAEYKRKEDENNSKGNSLK